MTFMDEITDFTYEIEPEEGFFVKKNNVWLDARQLSQGERTLMALIGDIARRLILLNPSRDNPLKGSGVVLIDEVELHLHPEWQQKILPNLIEVFPNIQFIITTHSPQVLTTCTNKEIRVLSKNGRAIEPVGNNYGGESNDALSELMDTAPRPPLKHVLLLAEYMKLIDLSESSSKKAIMLRKELEEMLGGNHHELMRADRKIKRKEILE